MKTLCVLLLAILASPVFAQRDDSRPNITAGKFWLTVVTQEIPTTYDVRLLDGLKHHPQLRSLRKQTVYHSWNSADPVMTTAWRAFLGDRFPILVIQAPADGRGNAEVVFASRDAILLSNPDRLILAIANAFNNYKQRNPRKFQIYTGWEPMEQCGPGGCQPWQPRRQPGRQPRVWVPVKPDPPAPINIPAPAPEPIIPDLGVDLPVVPDTEPDVLPIDIPDAPAMPADKLEQPNDEGVKIPVVLLLAPLVATGAGMFAGWRRSK